MPRTVHRFDPPDRFVAGTVGQPGERTFFLQATARGRTVSVALEKQQVSVLAERLEELLETARSMGGDIPTTPPVELEDTAPLDAPVEEEFRVGTMGLAWDGDAGRVVVEALAQAEDDTGGRAAVGGRGGSGRPAGAARARDGDGVRPAGPAGDRRRPAALPALRAAAGPRGAHLPAPERPPPLTVGVGSTQGARAVRMVA